MEVSSDTIKSFLNQVIFVERHLLNVSNDEA